MILKEVSKHIQDSSVVTAFFGGQTAAQAGAGTLPGCVWRCHISNHNEHDMMRWFKISQ
jgi:FtsP/CotA-like multicopper oxidase with cupredoxin domain